MLTAANPPSSSATPPAKPPRKSANVVRANSLPPEGVIPGGYSAIADPAGNDNMFLKPRPPPAAPGSISIADRTSTASSRSTDSTISTVVNGNNNPFEDDGSIEGASHSSHKTAAAADFASAREQLEKPFSGSSVAAVGSTTNSTAPPTPSSSSAATSSSSSPAKATSSPPTFKKVNFWGWVDVGFSHSTEDYDRTPINPDPLTKDGAIEVINMRLDFRKKTMELMQWRDEYEKAVQGHVTQDMVETLDEYVDRMDQMRNRNNTPSPGASSNSKVQQYPVVPYPRQSPMDPAGTVPPPPPASSSGAPPAKPPPPVKPSFLKPRALIPPVGMDRPHSHHEGTTTEPAERRRLASWVPSAVRWSWSEAAAKEHKQASHQSK